MRLYDYVEGLWMLTLVFADASVGALYLWSADSIRKGTANGLEGALGMACAGDAGYHDH